MSTCMSSFDCPPDLELSITPGEMLALIIRERIATDVVNEPFRG
jgi:hypothetical protein